MHARQQLRDAIVTAVTGLAITGSRVYTARVYPAQDTELPHLEVNTIEESAEPALVDGAIERQLVLEVTARARGTSGLVNTLDTIAEQVETVLGIAVTVGGTPVELAYQGASIQFSGEADQPIGSASLRFRATLYTAANAPGTLL